MVADGRLLGLTVPSYARLRVDARTDVRSAEGSPPASTGNVISGTVVNVAVVQTDPGYQSDPGHAGTGTVVALRGCDSE